MSEQRQAAIRRLRREAEALRKAIELEFSRASAPGNDGASYRRPGAEDLQDYSTTGPQTTDYRPTRARP
jgi:hypothetical protein